MKNANANGDLFPMLKYIEQVKNSGASKYVIDTVRGISSNLVQPKFVSDALEELESAESKFGNFNSAHEGYAVLLEEVDELWDVVKVNPEKIAMEGSREDRERAHRQMMRKEAVQVAAMALRFIKFLDSKDENGK